MDVKSGYVWERENARGKQEKKNKSISVGIDLGTTNSCVSVWLEKENRAKTIKNKETGKKTVKSAVRLDSSNQIIAVGDNAFLETQAPSVLVTNSKRLIGRRQDEVSLEEQSHFPFHIASSDAKSPVRILYSPPTSTSFLSRNYGIEPETISAAVLTQLKGMAEDFLGTRVDSAVVTVPAYFNEAQRAATKRAAELAGLKVLRLLSEPMAAAISYGLFVAGSKTVAIVDMGGGTFDVSLLDIDNGKFEAIALSGDNALGGNDVDNLLMNFALEKQGKSIEALCSQEKTALYAACEEAKIKLSSQDHAWITNDITIGRKQFEEMVKPLETRVRQVIRRALADAKLEPSKVDEVVLVGLSTQMPWLRRVVKEEFGGSKELCTSVKADRAVSQGAAIQAAIMSGVDSYLLSKVLMLDALPYSIGLETGSGGFAVVLPRNSRIPCSFTKTFTTHGDFQRAITVDIFEGENEVARENRWVDCIDFPVKNGSQLRAGEAVIDVTFSVDADGTLLVSAETKSNRKEPQEDEPQNVAFLLAVLVVLIALLFGVKAYLPPPPIEHHDDDPVHFQQL